MNNINYSSKEVKQIIRQIQKETGLSYTDIIYNNLPYIKKLICERLAENIIY